MGYRYNTRPVVEQGLSLSAAFLNKHGYFKTSRSGNVTWSRNGVVTSTISVFSTIFEEGEPKLSVDYTSSSTYQGQKEIEHYYQVKLVSQPCNFGGKRWYFTCPLTPGGLPCNRRVSVLYINNGILGCRHCHNLAYESQNRSGLYRYYDGGYVGIGFKIDELEKRIKRPYYAGRPTRLQRQKERLIARTGYTLVKAEEAMQELAAGLDGIKPIKYKKWE